MPPPSPASLATKLSELGYDAVLRTTITNASTCFRQLGHEFLAVRGEPEGSGEYIVEPHFREQFSIPHATPAYAELLACVPEEFVGESSRLVPVVEALCEAMAASFEACGLTLPPWRRTSSMLSKWLPARARDRLVPSSSGASPPGGASPGASPSSGASPTTGSSPEAAAAAGGAAGGGGRASRTLLPALSAASTDALTAALLRAATTTTTTTNSTAGNSNVSLFTIPMHALMEGDGDEQPHGGSAPSNSFAKVELCQRQVASAACNTVRSSADGNGNAADAGGGAGGGTPSRPHMTRQLSLLSNKLSRSNCNNASGNRSSSSVNSPSVCVHPPLHASLPPTYSVKVGFAAGRP